MNSGSIEYTISVETQAGIDAAAKINKSLDGTERQMKKTDGASAVLGGGFTRLASSIKRANADVSESNKRLSALRKVIGSVVAFMGTKAIIEMADQYSDMSSRIRQTTADTAEYNKVQQRLLKTANNTYRPLQEAQEVYIRTSDAIRQLGYNTDQALDITDSFSYLLVTNSASADSASSSINAYSKAIQTGKVDSQGWQSILAAIPSVVSDIASATGESEAAIRKLGIEGKLSLTALNEALLQSKDKNLELADAMDTTVGDATTAFKNSLQVFIGKVNESSGATGGLVKAIENMAELLQDPKTIKAAQDLASGIVLAFTKILEITTDVSEAVKFMAESFAAAMHGPALDDVVRMGDHIENLEQQAKNMADELGRTRIMRINPFKSTAELETEYRSILGQIEFYKKAVLAAQQLSLPTPDAPGEGGGKPKPKPPLVSATGPATAGRKQLTEAQRAALKAAQELERAERRNVVTLEAMAEALYQTGLSSEELAMRQAELSLNEYATPEQIARVRELARQLEEVNRFNELSDKAATLGKEDSITDKFAQEQAELLEMHQLKIITDEEYAEHKMVLERGMHDDLMVLAEERFRSQSTMNDLLISSLDSIGSHATDAFMDFATGAKTGKDAALAMAQAIGQSVVRAVVDMGVQMAVNAVKEKIFAAQSVATAATTGAAITAAYAPAAATASIATMGGAAAAGSTSMLASMGAMIAGALSFGGGRQYGGGVDGNSFYRVNEGGKPEIFNGSDGHQYMMPNQRGEVVSNKNASGGGITIHAPITVEAVDGMSDQEARKQGELMGDALTQRIKTVMGQEMAAGGMLWQG